MKGEKGVDWKVRATTYPTDDVVVAGQMGLAVLAPEDFVCVQVDVVREPHPCRSVERRRNGEGRWQGSLAKAEGCCGTWG